MCHKPLGYQQDTVMPLVNEQPADDFGTLAVNQSLEMWGLSSVGVL